jgi:hypothetical protein
MKNLTNMSLEEALVVMDGVPISPSEDFSPEINERLLVVESHARAQLAKVGTQHAENMNRLLGVAWRAPTRVKSVLWLQRASEAFAQATGPHAACRPGCNHCCHIPVRVNSVEASVVGKAIGRQPQPPEGHSSLSEASYTNPCTFLKGGQCSIYANRPAVCRSHFNMDRDDLLCRLVEGQSVPVPYADTRPFAMLSVAIGGEKGAWADLRQWFPS